MTHFIPGRVVTTFDSKTGKEVVVRYPKWEDLDTMTDWINELSAEDTFINYSGEVFSREMEASVMAEWFQAMEFGNQVFLGAFVNGELAGTCGVTRTAGKPRESHVASFGLAIRSKYRGEGVGARLARSTIDEAKKQVPGLRLVKLEVFGNNPLAYALYEKLGFREVGRIPAAIKHRGEYVDDVIMVLALS